MSGRVRGVVGVENREDRTFFPVLRHNPSGDALAGHVRKALVHELGGVGASLAGEMTVQPLSRNPLELTEDVQLQRCSFRGAASAPRRGPATWSRGVAW